MMQVLDGKEHDLFFLFGEMNGTITIIINAIAIKNSSLARISDQ